MEPILTHDAPLVSGIIIFLNAEKYLQEAIESVRAQTYPHWELLLVDDGSTDGSTALARRYAEAYPGRIRYLEHEGHANRGMSASRNLGVRHAQGAYVGFLDADDVWLPHKLEEQVALLTAHPEAAMVYGRTLIWHGWTGAVEDRGRDFFYDLGVPPDTLVSPPHLVELYLTRSVQTPTTCNALLRRTAIDAVDGFDEAFRGMFEDQVFFTKVCLRYPVYVAGACWARYRQHPESCYNKAERSGTRRQTRRVLLDWMTDYVSTHAGDHRARLLAVLRAQLWPYRHPHLHRLRLFGNRLRQRLRQRPAQPERREETKR